MDRQLVAVGERISLVMMGGTEAQLLVVGNRPRDIRDHENRLDTDDASHPRSIRVVACLRMSRGSSDIPERWRRAAFSLYLVTVPIQEGCAADLDAV